MRKLYNTIPIEDLFNAWYRFRKGKTKKIDVLLFENNLENNIYELFFDIQNQSYKHGGYKVFTLFDSKKRKIKKAQVRDRIVHEFLRLKLENHYKNKFIRNTYASIKNKGSIKAIKKLQTFIQETRLTLSLDIKKYFSSIDKNILLQKIGIDFEESSIEYLLSKEIILSYPDSGIPLGNSVSQVFSNIYFNDFDWIMIRHHPNYIRYNDDIRICASQFSTSGLIKISSYLLNEMKLIIPQNKILISRNYKGVKFLGFVVFPTHIILTNQTKSKILNSVTKENFVSYIGFIKNYHCHNFKQKINSFDII